MNYAEYSDWFYFQVSLNDPSIELCSQIAFWVDLSYDSRGIFLRISYFSLSRIELWFYIFQCTQVLITTEYMRPKYKMKQNSASYYVALKSELWN